MKLLTCNANTKLAQDIATYLDARLTSVDVKSFKDNEVFVRINENVRGQDVFVIQSTSAPASSFASNAKPHCVGLSSIWSM